jgi:large subunit ribosomal protein L34
VAACPREVTSIKRTYQPKKRYRRRVHGFLRRMSSVGGERIIRNRRRKGRRQLTPR